MNIFTKIWRWLFGRKEKPILVQQLPKPDQIKQMETKLPVKSIIMTTMTGQEKKELIQKRLDNGDKRSWYEIAADLELQIWTEKHS